MNNEILFYKEPAKKYLEAIPIGNGRLGAMVCGGVEAEKINLNDDTLWSGFPRTNVIYNAYERFTKRLRKKMLEENDYYAAEDFADRLQGPYNESYLPAGELLFSCPDHADASDYVRGLDIKRGVAFTEYTANGVKYRREAFVSAPDDIMVFRFTCDKKGAISTNIKLTGKIRNTVKCEKDEIALVARAPRHVEPQYLEYTAACRQAIVYDEEWEYQKGLRYECHAKIVSDAQKVFEENGGVSVVGASEVVVYLWIGTNYNPKLFIETQAIEDYCIRDLDITSLAKEKIASAVKKGYDSVYKSHVADMEEYFKRVVFAPEYDKALDELPTNERKKRYAEGNEDAGFEKQCFDFGRYMLYSSSRPGTRAANLQGIWNWDMRPAWSCNYTININTQMNYWGADAMNMPECHLPLMQLLDGISHTGSATATELYGARGFCAHHNVDLWCATIPAGLGETDNMWALFPTGGLWLSINVWEHYLFTRDVEFLKKYYHVLRGSALFAVDMMCEMPDGTLGICPATVPERRFTRADGTVFAVGAGSTFDYELATEIFDAVRQASVIIAADEKELVSQMDEVQKRFPPIPINSEGLITEWQFECVSTPYLWLAILYGVFPGHCLLDSSDELLSAAKKTLEVRDVTTRSFANCCYAGAWARMGRGDRAYQKLRAHLSDTLFDSLLGVNMSYPEPVFQIDSNLGIIAVVGEMLVQSTPNGIILLPALPDEWKNGSIEKIRTRCGCSVDVSWQDGKLKEFTISCDRDVTVFVSLGTNGAKKNISLCANKPQTFKYSDLV